MENCFVSSGQVQNLSEKKKERRKNIVYDQEQFRLIYCSYNILDNIFFIVVSFFCIRVLGVVQSCISILS